MPRLQVNPADELVRIKRKTNEKRTAYGRFFYAITEAIQTAASIMTNRGITMRLTVLDDDPGIKINPGRERITVYLDDVEVSRCLTADDEKGEVIVIATTNDGQLLVEDGELVHKTLQGKVRIERHGG